MEVGTVATPMAMEVCLLLPMSDDIKSGLGFSVCRPRYNYAISSLS